MADKHTLDAPTREGIDACRPGKDDIRLPELNNVARTVMEDSHAARHYDRVQRCDTRLQAAMHDVHVPDDLARRLLAHLQATHAATNETHAAITLPIESASPIKARRSWWPVALAASLLVAASALFAWQWQPSGNVDVVTLTEVWQNQLSEDWRPMATAPKQLGVPVRLAVEPQRWQPTRAYQGYAGVAYDVSRRGCRAVLFIVNVAPDGTLPKAPPMVPQFSAGGRAVAAWLSGKRLCMLVVDGDERAYRNLIRASQVPLA